MKRLQSLCAWFMVGLALAAETLPARGQQTNSTRKSSAIPGCRGKDIAIFVNKVLPLWSGSLEDQTEWRACARLIEPGSLEQRFCIEKEYSGAVRAEYVRATGTPLTDQFCKLNVRRPSALPADLAPSASVSKRQVQGGVALQDLARKLEHLELPLALPNVLVMDYPAYELEIRTQYGSTLLLELAGSPPTLLLSGLRMLRNC